MTLFQCLFGASLTYCCQFLGSSIERKYVWASTVTSRRRRVATSCLFRSSLPDHTKKQEHTGLGRTLFVLFLHYYLLRNIISKIDSQLTESLANAAGQWSKNWWTIRIYKKNYSFSTAHLMWMIIPAKLGVRTLHSLFHFKSNNMLDREGA